MSQARCESTGLRGRTGTLAPARRRNVFRVFRPSRMRLALQLGAGSVVVHELRYRLGPEHGERSLADHGHAYLTVITPLLGLALVLATAHFVWALWARRPEALAGGRIGVRTLAPALLAVHVGQESLEAALAFGHPFDLTVGLGHGGCIAAPLSLLVAAVLAWLTRGARHLAQAALARRRAPARIAARPAIATVATVLGPPCPPLARHGAERAPPLLAS